MRKLTEDEIKTLQDLKGTRGGSDRFFDIIEEIYKDDIDTMKDILLCHDIKDSLEWIETYPAYQKSTKMYYEYMDALLEKIGYRKK